jgi:stress-induced-phosphoprotein 1
MEAKQFKEDGNLSWLAGDYPSAIQHFTKAIDMSSSNIELLKVLYSNRSAANLKIMAFKNGLSDAEMCIKLDPMWLKGYARKGAF